MESECETGLIELFVLSCLASACAASLKPGRHSRAGTGMAAATSEVSLVSLLTEHNLMRSLKASTHGPDCAIHAQIMKMAACMIMLTGACGAYSQVNP